MWEWHYLWKSRFAGRELCLRQLLCSQRADGSVCITLLLQEVCAFCTLQWLSSWDTLLPPATPIWCASAEVRCALVWGESQAQCDLTWAAPCGCQHSTCGWWVLGKGSPGWASHLPWQGTCVHSFCLVNVASTTIWWHLFLCLSMSSQENSKFIRLEKWGGAHVEKVWQCSVNWPSEDSASWPQRQCAGWNLC